MGRPAAARLKVNPPLGRMPVLQFLRPGELGVDAHYQRSIDQGPSQTLIRKIAQHWNWDLCLPLVVAARPNGDLMVIDGQHRLAAAKLRGDIAQLPCVVVHYDSAADEAASFVHLNQQRRPLTRIDVFRAAVASEDPEASAILNAMGEAGLYLAPHTNYTAWKPGMVANIAGIEAAWRKYGERATGAAMRVLAQSYPAEVLRYGGSIFPGIAFVCGEHDGVNEARLSAMIGRKPQVEWRNAIMAARADNPNLKFSAASAVVIGAAWEEFPASRPESLANWPALKPIRFDGDADGKSWCEQCEQRRSFAQAESCKSNFCSFRRAA